MSNIQILQTICPECGHECWRNAADDDWLYCPECGAKLNQQSSEDADEGLFVTTALTDDNEYKHFAYDASNAFNHYLQLMADEIVKLIIGKRRFERTKQQRGGV